MDLQFRKEENTFPIYLAKIKPETEMFWPKHLKIMSKDRRSFNYVLTNSLVCKKRRESMDLLLFVINVCLRV